jgi:hypothetical protein
MPILSKQEILEHGGKFVYKIYRDCQHLKTEYFLNDGELFHTLFINGEEQYTSKSNMSVNELYELYGATPDIDDDELVSSSWQYIFPQEY